MTKGSRINAVGLMHSSLRKPMQERGLVRPTKTQGAFVALQNTFPIVLRDSLIAIKGVFIFSLYEGSFFASFEDFIRWRLLYAITGLEGKIFMPQFNRGDRVVISPTTSSPFAGVEGVVDEVTPNPKMLAQLDSYVVVFAWGERHQFWDAELKATPASKSQNDDDTP